MVFVIGETTVFSKDEGSVYICRQSCESSHVASS
jgi:hypothetical protein